MNAHSTPPAPNTPAPAATTPLASSPQGPQAEISEAEAAKMSEWVKQDLAAGKLTPEQADKAFNELGRTPEQRGPDTRTEEQKTLDQHFPAAKPEDYRLSYADPGQDPPEMTPELKQFDQSARTWMSTAGFPRDVGNSLVNAIAKTAQLTKDMNADQLDQYGADEFVKLERAHGPALDDKLRAAGRMVEDLERKQPGLKQLLKSKGIGDSAMVANLLMGHAQVYHARRGAQGAR
jgi:hypothetical protein